jgi:hypothetical protein
MTEYTTVDLKDAPIGHLPFPGTDVEIVAYQTGSTLTILANKGSQCLYRVTIEGIFDDLDPNVMHYPINDGFRVVKVNGAPTLADTSGAFERLLKHLEQLSRKA